MRKRALKPLALFVALSFASGGASAALGERVCIYHASADEAAATQAAEHASGSHGHAGHAPASGGETSQEGGSHSHGCDCFGQCIGGAAPPALAESACASAPPVSGSTGESAPATTPSVRTQAPFLLPFANAPPALS